MFEIPKFTVDFMDNSYLFDYGSEVFIFHTGLYNEMYVKYGMGGLLSYVEVVQRCYMSDDNRTPLGSFADYVAENWEQVKNKSKYQILDEFYSQEF